MVLEGAKRWWLTPSYGGLPKEYFSAVVCDDGRRLQGGSALVRTHCGRTRGDRIEPALQGREVAEVLRLHFPRNDPGIYRNVGDGIIFTRQVGIGGESPIEHPIETIGLIHIAFDRIWNLLRCVTTEVMILARHGAEPPTCQNSHSTAAFRPRKSFGRRTPAFSAK